MKSYYEQVKLKFEIYMSSEISGEVKTTKKEEQSQAEEEAEAGANHLLGEGTEDLLDDSDEDSSFEKQNNYILEFILERDALCAFIIFNLSFFAFQPSMSGEFAF